MARKKRANRSKNLFNYQLKVDFARIRKERFRENVRYLVPITFQGDSIQYVPLGQNAIIKCQVQASPIAEVSWFKGEDKTRIGSLKSFVSDFKKLDFILIENPNYEFHQNGLRINQVSMSDNDTFWCRADVLETGESRDYRINVIVSSRLAFEENLSLKILSFSLIRTNQSNTHSLHKSMCYREENSDINMRSIGFANTEILVVLRIGMICNNFLFE